MAEIPKGFSTSVHLSGVMPDSVVAFLVAGGTYETAAALRNILSDLAAVVVLREGPRGTADAAHRLKNLATVLTNAGDKHIAQISLDFRRFLEQAAEADGSLHNVDAIEKVAEADAIARDWLSRIAKTAAQSPQPPEGEEET